jgi:DNA processing protein
MAEAESIYHKPFKINGERLRIESARRRAEWELDFCSERGIQILQIGQRPYPEYLAAIDDPPLLLFANGETQLLGEELLFAIVGARKASNSSINRAFSIARDLSRSGLVIVSGLASGIDYYAHKGALDSGGKTVAILGNGINVVYPKANRDMYEAIGKEGLMLSEFPIGTEPLKYNFPKRNRIISGLSRGILVVEASARSGALITAGYALDQGREVMALPGKAGSDSFSGNNHIIKEGAHLVEDAVDICALFGIQCSNIRDNKTLPFSSLECNILTVMGDDLVSIEDIERNLETPVSKIASALTHLELKGAVVQYPGKHFTRVHEHG